jgi:hypothetical protein
MRPAQREAVVAAVTEDKIPYRGDDFGFFMAVVDETLRMRGMGKAEYLKQNGHVLESRGIPVQSDVQ